MVLQEPESESCIRVNFSEILITGKKSSSKPSIRKAEKWVEIQGKQIDLKRSKR